MTSLKTIAAAATLSAVAGVAYALYLRGEPAAPGLLEALEDAPLLDIMAPDEAREFTSLTLTEAQERLGRKLHAQVTPDRQ